MRRNNLGNLFRRTPIAIMRWSANLRSGYGVPREQHYLEALSRSTRRLILKIRSVLFRQNCAQERGLALLMENLSPNQRKDLEYRRYFLVIGGDTGRRYRINQGCQMNVHQLREDNLTEYIWCFYPGGGLVAEDVMLAQKLALELFEDEALVCANRIPKYCDFY